jgi:hypothetical protein
MTQDQINWAAQHDWYVEPIADGVRVRDIAYAPDAKDDVMIERIFRDFRALRNWAGY